MSKGFPEEGRDEAGRIKPGYALWRLRTKHGRNAIYEDAERLWTACCAYFDETHDSPLEEEKAFSGGGGVIRASIAKMRSFTLKGLCLHLQISDETWREWRKNRDDLKEVISTVESVIYTQKFEGAAAGLLNASIIARDLGLADKQEVSGTIETKTSTTDVARGIAFIFASAMKEKKNNEAEASKTTENRA